MKTCLSLVLVVFSWTNFSSAQSKSEIAKSPIADAEQRDDRDRVAKLIMQKADVSAPQADGMTALHWAVFKGQFPRVCFLHHHGADVNAMTIYQVSPLSLACEGGHAKIAKRLLNRKGRPGADVEAKRLGGETPLMLAARNGNAELVRILIEAGAKVDVKEVKGQTALMWAAAAGNVEAVDELLKAGSDLTIQTKLGFSAIMFAARQGKTDVVMRLLDEGHNDVDVNSVIKPLRTSGRNPRNGMSATLFAIENGHFELALKLVKRGADPNDQRSGFTPLHAITWVRKTKRGDDPDGDPAPRTTGSLNSLDFVRELVDAGADVNLQLNSGKSPGKAKLNSKGASPFLFAARSADIPLMKLMLELGADPKLTNVDQCNALMAAAGVGVVAVGEEPGTEEEVCEAIKMLVELGVDINAVDKNGETAMHGAAYRNFPEVVQLLAALGADKTIWNQQNKHGWTPHLIATGKRPGSVKPSPETIAALDKALDR